MKSCLVLEGGGMRGIYTAGVIDVLLDNNLSFDAVMGVSAGALHGCCYVSKQNGRSIRYYKKYCNDKRFMSLYSLVTTGSLVGEQFCYHDIPDILDPFDYDTFMESPVEFYAVCTDIEKGKPIYAKLNDLRKQMDYMLASASLPLVSKTVEIDGRKLLDGGITDSIPVMAAKKLGYEKIVVVQTRPDGYIKSSEASSAARVIYRKYPNLIKAIENRHIMYNKQTELVRQLAENGEIVRVLPSQKTKISRTEKDVGKINEMYLLGRHDAENKIDEISEYLENNSDM